MRVNLLFLILILFALASCSEDNGSAESVNVSESLSGTTAEGFARVDKPREFSFPEDFGPHPEYQTEWWYYTGNLSTKDSREFGYQLTFFRRALTPEDIKRESDWSTNQIYFAHFALTDIKNEKFYSTEKWSRGAAGLAGAQTSPFRVWIDGWEITGDPKKVQLNVSDGDVSLKLSLMPLKPIVLQGDKGLSQKSRDPGNASYYFSQTRINSKGKITIDGQVFEVSGLSWLDREWSTSALGEDQEGWDWFSIQLDDGREIMLYQLRLKDGGVDPYSSGTLVLKDGKTLPIKSKDFDIKVLDNWTSPETENVYPSKWSISIPKYDINLTVTPVQNNQELLLSFVYWEGAVRVSGEKISGKGYVELTGY
ncbi:MAG: lipocalin-like domain-containing protein [Thermodesulfobacteriota bacterium]